MQYLTRAGFLGLLALVLAVTAGTSAPARADKAPGPGINDVAIDFNKSFIDTTIKQDVFYVTIVVNYETTGAGYMITADVFDENTQAFAAASNGPNSTTFTTTGPGTGTVTFYYEIAANSNWGQAITNGTFDMAWVVVAMNSTTRFVDGDEGWLYAPPE